MEIELIKKGQEEKKVKFKDLEVGTVIEVGLHTLMVIQPRNGDKEILYLDNALNVTNGNVLTRRKEGDLKVIGKATKI